MKKYLLTAALIATLSLPLISHAAPLPPDSGGAGERVSYIPLAPIEGTYDTCTADGNCQTDFLVYVSGLSKLAIGFSFVLAILMIIWGGVEYISTDAVYNKNDGKQKIQNALIGLLLVISAYVILRTINPTLVEFSLNEITSPRNGTGGTGAPASPTN